MEKTDHTNNNQNNWSDAWPALILLLLHAICCIGVALLVLLGGISLSALLASKGFWVAAVAVVLISFIGYWYFKRNK